MRRISKIFIAVLLVTVAMAQSPEPPLSDPRLSIHTLVREDIFAGFLTDDMERFAKGEKNIQTLLEKRPAARAELLSWQAGAALYRAARAHERNRSDEFQRYYKQSLDLFSQAKQLDPNNGGVAAVTGGAYVVLGDRLPKEHQGAAWAQAYDSFQILWKQQSAIVDKLPAHLCGELLGGLAQSAMRAGRTEEAAQYLDKILVLMANTPYESIAKKWKADPKSAANSSITCLTCHDSGRLAARLAALSK
jgi:tetratricopeptide (TPR) repeat protein